MNTTMIHSTTTERVPFSQTTLSNFAYGDNLSEHRIAFTTNAFDTAPTAASMHAAAVSIAEAPSRNSLLRLPPSVVAENHKINVVDADTVPIQRWEGRVLEMDVNAQTMDVLLSAKNGSIPDHTGTIDLQWVQEQDQNLVKPGAIFYLTLFKRSKFGGTVENSQELRFRRRPNWSKIQLDMIELRGKRLRSKLKTKPMAE